MTLADEERIQRCIQEYSNPDIKEKFTIVIHNRYVTNHVPEIIRTFADKHVRKVLHIPVSEFVKQVLPEFKTEDICSGDDFISNMNYTNRFIDEFELTISLECSDKLNFRWLKILSAKYVNSILVKMSIYGSKMIKYDPVR